MSSGLESAKESMRVSVANIRLKPLEIIHQNDEDSNRFSESTLNVLDMMKKMKAQHWVRESGFEDTSRPSMAGFKFKRPAELFKQQKKAMS